MSEALSRRTFLKEAQENSIHNEINEKTFPSTIADF